MATTGLKVYDVTSSPYSADPSLADNTAAFQAAINDAHTSAVSAIVYVSKPGVYTFTGVLTMYNNVALVGTRGGLSDYSPPVTLAITSTAAPFISLTGCGALVENFMFTYPNQNVTSPIAYPFTIAELQDDRGGTVLRNLVFVHCYQGIWLGAKNGSDTSGRATVENILMQPLLVGIRVDHTEDVSRLVNIHMFNYANESAYSKANCREIWAQRADGLQVLNYFAINLFAAVYCSDSPDTTQPGVLCSYGQITNMNTDTCMNGFVATSTYSTSQNHAPGWCITNWMCGASGTVSAAVNLSPGGVTGAYAPTLQVIGGSIWGSYTASNKVAKGSTSDFFAATGWLNYP